MYSRLGYFAIKPESTDNTAVKPTVFFGAIDENVVAKYKPTPSSPILGSRIINVNAVPDKIEAPSGKITLQVEPKNIGYFLKAVFGAPLTGVFFPISSASGAFTVGETVTGGTSNKTAVVVAVSNEKDYLLVSTLSGAFTIGETITGGSSSKTATLGTYDSTVYGHDFAAPQNSMTTFTLEVGYLNEAIRFTGVKFHGFSLSEKNNILESSIDVTARAQFLNARVQAVVNSSGSPVTITVDQTQGIVATDTIKVFRPSTGAYLDLNGSGVKTHTVSSLVAETSITIPSLTTSLAVGDLVVLAPQTPSYSVAKEMAWIGASTVKIGDTPTAAVASSTLADIETFDITVNNEVEARYAAAGNTVASRFPSGVFLKGFKLEGKMKHAYADHTYLDRLRNITDTAICVSHFGTKIGSTAIKYRLDWRLPLVALMPWNPDLKSDALVDEEIPFELYRDTADGYSAKAVLVTDSANFN